MRSPLLPATRVRSAFIVAVVVDVLQLPVVLGMFGAFLSVFGAVAELPLEGVDLALDIAAAVIINRLLGFHWILLPTAIGEAIPGLDALPTWTLCVAWVARREKRLGRAPAPRAGELPVREVR
jgi:hypothetical protein